MKEFQMPFWHNLKAVHHLNLFAYIPQFPLQKLNSIYSRLIIFVMFQGQKEVSYDQFVNLWKQFFTSENPSDPGNFIFGKTKF